jgi:hypothetical protein
MTNGLEKENSPCVYFHYLSNFSKCKIDKPSHQHYDLIRTVTHDLLRVGGLITSLVSTTTESALLIVVARSLLV